MKSENSLCDVVNKRNKMIRSKFHGSDTMKKGFGLREISHPYKTIVTYFRIIEIVVFRHNSWI